MPKVIDKKVVISKEEIHKKIVAVAKQITDDYKDKDAPLVCVGILKGAVIFFADLVKEIDLDDMMLDFMRVSSYGNGSESSHDLKITKNIELDIVGKHLLLVEDIIDSGFTMAKLSEYFKDKGAASVKICALIDKKERREVDVHIDYALFELDSGFIVGYGLDYAEKYRQLPEIYEVTIE